MIHPSTTKASSNFGIAVISLDFSFTLTCLSTKLLSLAHALTIWISDFLPFDFALFPSIAIICPFLITEIENLPTL